MAEGQRQDVAPPDYERIKEWRSIVTLVVFIVTNIVVLFPFHIPIYSPRTLSNAFLDLLSAIRIIPRRGAEDADDESRHEEHHGSPVTRKPSRFVRLDFSMNIVTAPLVADLFLLAILAIGRQEVVEGTLGANNISPLDIMLFFITLAYIAISIDASGVIRYLAFKVLQWGGEVGHRLFFYLYAFWFVLTSFVGNDPVILSGTAFLAYMTRVSSNIVHPRAWIYSQFAVANIASAILVSSNPTNLVLAGAFEIKFIDYTANMIVPVIVTGIVLFPFLLFIVFNDESLIPRSIKMHELPEDARRRKPINPNIPHGRGAAEEQEDAPGEQGKLLSLEEIINPFLDRKGAIFGAVIMAGTLIAVLALNAASTGVHTTPVYYITLPAAVVMFVWDVAFGWIHRHETREIARKGREEVERLRLQRALQEAEKRAIAGQGHSVSSGLSIAAKPTSPDPGLLQARRSSVQVNTSVDEAAATGNATEKSPTTELKTENSGEPATVVEPRPTPKPPHQPTTLVSLCRDAFRWSQETFPTATAVIAHLPFALVPFAFSMFVLVQALVTKGWVQVFALGWDIWVRKTGTIGAIAGMGFLSVILCNFSGTNIGTTILLSRVIQAWKAIHYADGTPIANRTFWATVYTMALGVNYGAFSTAFSASLAGLLWRDILAKKHIHVRRLDFARVNLPVIAIAMTVGCVVLIGEVWIMRDMSPVDLR
ncbi:putative arsenite transmembrane transporter protein [Parathielavia hyrcaniae]|uniref:Arsenite transmembrane transporter protein n=1 Tax=Parathielavia hyrcaniae TaxID=113614 RepID=A0AAN6SYT4_9PEZI|nr:putative arsenite transmembrane transporter protein [Parathielavia hyrcaniae]